jgi:hypothetical protein
MTDLTKPVTRRVTTARIRDFKLPALIITMRPEGLAVRLERQRASSERLIPWDSIDWQATKASLTPEQRAAVAPRPLKRGRR